MADDIVHPKSEALRMAARAADVEKASTVRLLLEAADDLDAAYKVLYDESRKMDLLRGTIDQFIIHLDGDGFISADVKDWYIRGNKKHQF